MICTRMGNLGPTVIYSIFHFVNSTVKIVPDYPRRFLAQPHHEPTRKTSQKLTRNPLVDERECSF